MFRWAGLLLVVGWTFSRSIVMAQPSSRPTTRPSSASQPPPSITIEKRSKLVFHRIVQKAQRAGWQALPIGQLLGQVAKEFLGTPYKGGTLESSDGKERCTVNLVALDCVTLFENSLAIARVIKKQKMTWGALIKEVTYLRYRKGRLSGYVSRLHYMTEWLEDNRQKTVIQKLTKKLGGALKTKSIHFMSKHARAYKALRHDPKLVSAITKIERRISRLPFYYVPTAKLASIEKHLRTGDLVFMASITKGLDYGHTGLIVVDTKGLARFLHASPHDKKVVLDKPLHQAAQAYKRLLGMSFARPLTP